MASFVHHPLTESGVADVNRNLNHYFKSLGLCSIKEVYPSNRSVISELSCGFHVRIGKNDSANHHRNELTGRLHIPERIVGPVDHIRAACKPGSDLFGFLTCYTIKSTSGGQTLFTPVCGSWFAAAESENDYKDRELKGVFCWTKFPESVQKELQQAYLLKALVDGLWWKADYQDTTADSERFVSIVGEDLLAFPFFSFELLSALPDNIAPQHYAPADPTAKAVNHTSMGKCPCRKLKSDPNAATHILISASRFRGYLSDLMNTRKRTPAGGPIMHNVLYGDPSEAVRRAVMEETERLTARMRVEKASRPSPTVRVKRRHSQIDIEDNIKRRRKECQDESVPSSANDATTEIDAQSNPPPQEPLPPLIKHVSPIDRQVSMEEVQATVTVHEDILPPTPEMPNLAVPIGQPSSASRRMSVMTHDGTPSAKCRAKKSFPNVPSPSSPTQNGVIHPPVKRPLPSAPPPQINREAEVTVLDTPRVLDTTVKVAETAETMARHRHSEPVPVTPSVTSGLPSNYPSNPPPVTHPPAFVRGYPVPGYPTGPGAYQNHVNRATMPSNPLMMPTGNPLMAPNALYAAAGYPPYVMGPGGMRPNLMAHPGVRPINMAAQQIPSSFMPRPNMRQRPPVEFQID